MQLRFPRLGKKAWALVIAAACFAAGGAVFGSMAFASIPDSGGTIHGCYRNTTGGLRVIDTGASGACLGDETSLNWSQSATAGPAGLDLEVLWACGPTTGSGTCSYNAASGSSGNTIYLECPTDHPYIISGGVDDNPSSGYAATSEPWDFTTNAAVGYNTNGPVEQTTDQYGWRAIVSQTGNHFHVMAICAK